MRKAGIVGLMIAALAGSGGALAFDNCTPTVNIVYAGSTAVNPSIIQAGNDLYGAPLSNCSTTIQTFRALRDLDGNGSKESCVQLYVSNNLGSCEGVQALDRAVGGFNVCTPTAGSTTQVSVNTLHDELGATLFANYAGSDVGADVCEKVISGGLTRSDVFTDTETRPFAIPFAFIANRNIESILPSRDKTPFAGGASCPAGYGGDCPRVEFGFTKDQLKGIFGNNNVCDWRSLSPEILPGSAHMIGGVMRQRLSGTRNLFNQEMLETLGAGQGSLFESGTGAVITAVNGNQACSPTFRSLCGESAAGVVGGQVSPCEAVPSPISLGMVGTDQFVIIDNNTPADPFDDYAVRGKVADNYDVLEYQGQQYNKANLRCGHYEYWSFERIYFDENYMAPGSFREAAALELNNQLAADAVLNPNVVAINQLFVSRARDGSPIFPTGPFNAFCNEP
ncbi:MAG TPA: hypothetical protein VE404_07590 [Verrucomicrobiae bacterium]|nr:hypothetical protein [Verrucomicrobiae bacterium]